MLSRLRLTLLVVCTASLTAAAEVRLPHVLSDHAVLQRDKPVRIWGWSAGGEAVTVKFHDQTVTTKADIYGQWEAWLRPEKAGGPYTLTVSGDATATPLVREDILLGDVWLASGQSNMEFPMTGWATAKMNDSEKEIAAADHPRIHLLIQSRRISDIPLADTDDTWVLCTPETVKKFSAVAYFFGRRISETEKVPVGLIDTTWGGTPVHSWISAGGIAWSGLESIAFQRALAVSATGNAAAIKAQYAAEDAKAKAEGKELTTHPNLPADRPHWIPSGLYNGMIAPYTNYSIRGALWYQGEADGELARSVYYSRSFPAMIQDWRKQWGEGEFPFLFVQISSYNGAAGYGGVRDAQRRTLELVNTGMAVSLDIGLPTNVHPPDKETVGARLAGAALSMVYGEKEETTSPLFVQATTEGNSIRAWFSHAEGLKSADASPGDFEVAGANMKFVAATAKIEKIGLDETVVATAPEVPEPKYIRYGWTPYVKSYLYNAAGLPMSTFTSESDAQMLMP